MPRGIFHALAVAVTAGVLGTGACAPAWERAIEDEIEATEAEAEASPLAGTSWRLVELQSMDDSIGIVRPEDPDRYTMALLEGGTASMVLNCNRASGPWSAEAASDESGSFSIGPLAMTRMLCPSPSLDERLARELEYVRSYLLRAGRLHLSLMADGGIQVWEPAPASDGNS